MALQFPPVAPPTWYVPDMESPETVPEYVIAVEPTVPNRIEFPDDPVEVDRPVGRELDASRELRVRLRPGEGERPVERAVVLPRPRP